MTTTIPRSALGIHRAAGANSRYQLSNVLIERETPDTMVAVATDGRAMVVLGWKDTDGNGTPCKVCSGQLKEYDRAKTRSITVNETSVTVNEKKGGSITTELQPPAEGRYPSWRDIVPKDHQETLSVVLDIALLERVLGALREHCLIDGTPQVTLSLYREDTGTRPVVLTGLTPEGNTTYALVMPRVADDTGVKWAPSTAAPELEEAK